MLPLLLPWELRWSLNSAHFSQCATLRLRSPRELRRELNGAQSVEHAMLRLLPSREHQKPLNNEAIAWLPVVLLGALRLLAKLCIKELLNCKQLLGIKLLCDGHQNLWEIDEFSKPSIMIHYAVQKDIVIDRMSNTCLYCKALTWPEDSVGLCCSNGKVRLPTILDTPQPLNPFCLVGISILNGFIILHFK